MSSTISAKAKCSNNSLSEEQQIREELSQMTFEELLKLKDELGSKVYTETILCKGNKESNDESNEINGKQAPTAKIKPKKRLNHNQPREESSKRMVPFMGAEHRRKKLKAIESRDPRFDERSGEYNTKIFKTNYEFLSKIREDEIKQLKNKLKQSNDPESQIQMRKTIQKLNNKNVEERKWHQRQTMIKEEKDKIQQAKQEGKKIHYLTKGEMKAKMLVTQFEELKAAGRLQKHLEKRRRKRAVKDRKKFQFN